MSPKFTQENITEKAEFTYLAKEGGDKHVLMSENWNRWYIAFDEKITEQQIATIFGLVKQKMQLGENSLIMRQDDMHTVLLLQPVVSLPPVEELESLYQEIIKKLNNN